MKKVFLLFYLYLLPFSIHSHEMPCSDECTPINSHLFTQSLCPGDLAPSILNTSNVYNACYLEDKAIQLNNFTNSLVTVIADYSMCDAGMLESRVFARIANRFYSIYGPNTAFIQSIRGSEKSCDKWSRSYNVFSPALDASTNIEMNNMTPLIIYNLDEESRDVLFTDQHSSPSYIILDKELRVRYKFNSPCCGVQTCTSCTLSTVMELDDKLSNFVTNILETTGDPKVTALNETAIAQNRSCIIGNWTAWTPECCHAHAKVRYRFRTVSGRSCPLSIDTQLCTEENQCQGSFYRFKGISLTGTKGGITRIAVFLVAVILLPIAYSMFLKRMRKRNLQRQLEDGDTVLSEKDSESDSIED